MRAARPDFGSRLSHYNYLLGDAAVIEAREGLAAGDAKVLFTCEAMCEEPERVAGRIRTLVPALRDLNLRQNLRQRLPVKGRYDEMLTNMNARQIARLDAGRIAAFNRMFRAHRDGLEHFGYELMEENGG